MRAVSVKEPGGPEQLYLADVSEPAVGEHDVLIEVRATALNRADLLQRRGLYPPPAGASEILGLECAGVVKRIGASVAACAVGDRVMALLPGGGYAEYAAVNEHLTLPIPDPLNFTQAAAIPEAFLTAQEALFSLGNLQPRERVLIHAAAGGVGSAAVQLAHDAGAIVFATASRPEKLRLVQELGADCAINYVTEEFTDVVRRHTAGHGVDVILDFIGGSYWPKHAACLAEAGRCVTLGLLGGRTAAIDLSQLLMKRWQLLGLVMRSRTLTDKIAIVRRFCRSALPKFADGRLHPVIDSVLPIEQVDSAHRRMEQNENLGKIVLTF